MTKAVENLNRLVEEFDEATNYRFDRITLPKALVRMAVMLPDANFRASELQAAFEAVNNGAQAPQPER